MMFTVSIYYENVLVLQVKRESALNQFSESQIVLRFIQMVFTFALMLGKIKWDTFCPCGMTVIRIILIIPLKMAISSCK